MCCFVNANSQLNRKSKVMNTFLTCDAVFALHEILKRCGNFVKPREKEYISGQYPLFDVNTEKTNGIPFM